MLDLDAIRARAEQATEGPWAWEATGEKDNSWSVGVVMDEDEHLLSGELEPGQGIVVDGVCEGISDLLADAEFIAHARADIPALLEELRSLRARCDIFRRDLVIAETEVERLQEIRALTIEELERLRPLRDAVAAWASAKRATELADPTAERTLELFQAFIRAEHALEQATLAALDGQPDQPEEAERG